MASRSTHKGSKSKRRDKHTRASDRLSAVAFNLVSLGLDVVNNENCAVSTNDNILGVRRRNIISDCLVPQSDLDRLFFIL